MRRASGWRLLVRTEEYTFDPSVGRPDANEHRTVPRSGSAEERLQLEQQTTEDRSETAEDGADCHVPAGCGKRVGLDRSARSGVTRAGVV